MFISQKPVNSFSEQISLWRLYDGSIDRKWFKLCFTKMKNRVTSLQHVHCAR